MKNLEINDVTKNDIEKSNESEKNPEVEFKEDRITIKGNEEQVMELMKKITEETESIIKLEYLESVIKNGVISGEEIILPSGRMIFIAGFNRNGSLELDLKSAYGNAEFNESAKKEIEEIVKQLVE